VARAWGQTLQGEITLPPPRRQAHALVFAAPKASGLFAVQLAPKALELSEDKVVEYLDEIHASAALRQTWQQAPAPRRWREQYRKHSKTLSAAGGDAARLYGQVLGLGMEVVLETNPATLAPGAPLHIRLLQQGVAKASLPVALVGEGGAETAVATTDAEGRALLVVPKPGRWLIRATDLRPSQQPGLDWESDFATLTFRVFPH
jgi:hypothetical protein